MKESQEKIPRVWLRISDGVRLGGAPLFPPAGGPRGPKGASGRPHSPQRPLPLCLLRVGPCPDDLALSQYDHNLSYSLYI